MTISFPDFMTTVDFHIASYSEGLVHSDFADTAWFDLYVDTNGEADCHDIVETLAEADALFQEMARLNGAYV